MTPTQIPIFSVKPDPCKAAPDTLKIKRMHETTPELSSYATAGSAGMDVRADFSDPYDELSINDSWHLIPGDTMMIPTGLSLEIPEGYEVQVRPRSGLAAKNGVTVLNTPGTIDSDYRGQVKVILINHGPNTFLVKHGDRIAQFVLAKVARLPLVEVKGLTTTARGDGGFGSSGVK